MKVIYNSIIPFKGFIGINLFGILFCRSEYMRYVNDAVINHETIHTRQMKELLYLPFYILYFLEWFIKLFVCLYNPKHIKHYAYYSISFEQEALYNEKDYHYLDERKKYAWLKYMFKLYDKEKMKK